MTQIQIDDEIRRLKAERSRIERRIEELKNAKFSAGNCVYYKNGTEHVVSVRPEEGGVSHMKKSHILVKQASKTLCVSELENLVTNLTKILKTLKGGEVDV